MGAYHARSTRQGVRRGFSALDPYAARGIVNRMTLRDYLDRRGETQMSFAARAGISQQAVSAICCGRGAGLQTAAKIVAASAEEPAPGGGIVNYRDLFPAEKARAS